MSKSLGVKRERQVLHHMREKDWLAFRAPASLGVADVIALRSDSRPRLIEVKSDTAGPYHAFGPARRRALSQAAALAGADAMLAWWPPHGVLQFIGEASWPQ